jgi:hypothetical protein
MIDISKPVQQRNGLPAEVFTTNAKHDVYTIIGKRQRPDGAESCASWTTEGRYYARGEAHEFDLINVPPRTHLFVPFVEDAMYACPYQFLDSAWSKSPEVSQVLELIFEGGKLIETKIHCEPPT